MRRRDFLKGSLGAAASALTLTSPALRAADRRWKAAIIGDTGHGDYGHDHVLIFNERPNVTVLAVADPDPAGRAQAAARSHALRQYDDYRQMLEKEKPELVCVAPRWTDQHHAMGQAALEAGAHLYMEKPLTQTLAEADDLLSLARSKNLKIVVAHQMPLALAILHLQKVLSQGRIGDLLQIHAHGKQDRRAGGEDMVVLGTHLFDLMRLFAGDALWCTARILQNNREVTLQDVRQPTEPIGPVIGDQIDAQFAFAQGRFGTYTSHPAYRETAGPWGMELHGSKGIIRILTEMFPHIYLLRAGSWGEAGRVDRWERLPDDPALRATPEERGFTFANRRLVDDWLAAIVQDREPVCSGTRAMKSLEMIMAVFQAGVSKTRVQFPMINRQHPLGRSA